MLFSPWTTTINLTRRTYSFTRTKLADSRTLTLLTVSINNITMTLPGHTFLAAIINPFEVQATGDLLIKVTMSDSSSFTFTDGRTHGDNGGEMISSITNRIRRYRS